jgi:hypothetical protein
VPILSYPIDKDGYFVPVLVGLDQRAVLALHSLGLPILAPIHGCGLIDSGTDITCVDGSILQQYRLTPAHTATTTTASGRTSVKHFEVSFSIAPLSGQPGQQFVHPTLLVMELPASIPGIDVLVGRDVLNLCKTIIDGPGNGFSIEF